MPLNDLRKASSIHYIASIRICFIMTAWYALRNCVFLRYICLLERSRENAIGEIINNNSYINLALPGWKD